MLLSLWWGFDLCKCCTVRVNEKLCGSREQCESNLFPASPGPRRPALWLLAHSSLTNISNRYYTHHLLNLHLLHITIVWCLKDVVYFLTTGMLSLVYHLKIPLILCWCSRNVWRLYKTIGCERLYLGCEGKSCWVVPSLPPVQMHLEKDWTARRHLKQAHTDKYVQKLQEKRTISNCVVFKAVKRMVLLTSLFISMFFTGWMQIKGFECVCLCAYPLYQ